MNSIKDITNKNLPDSSIRAQELKNIYQKWGKYIDEGFGSLNFWKYGSITGVIVFAYFACFMEGQIIVLSAGLIALVFIYFYSKRTWYREGFYDGYACGKQDAFDEVFEVEGVREAAEETIIKRRHSRK